MRGKKQERERERNQNVHDRKRSRKIRSLLSKGAAMVMAGSLLTGCSSKTPEPGSIPGYNPGETYLSIWVHSIEDTDEGRVYRQGVDRFNEMYDGEYFADIEFVPRNDSGGGYSDKINASVMSGSLPDVLTVDGPNVAAYAENGIIQPLAELTDEERGIYLESILDQGTYQDQLYALGSMESSVGMYYNKDILKEAGIEVPEADHPWTWSEFLDICAELKPLMDEKGGYVLDMTFPVGESTIYYYAPFVWSNGGNLVSPNGLEVEGYFDSEEVKEAAEMFSTLVDEGYMSPTPVDKLFESGRAAFKFDGAWEVNTIYNEYEDINLGVAPYIVSDQWDGGRYTPTGSWAFAASSNSDNIEGATKLIQVMSGVESGKDMWNMSRTFPSTYEAFESIDIFSEDENYNALYQQLLNYGHPRPKTPAYPSVSSYFQKVLENTALQHMDLESEMEKAIGKINDKLERYKD